MNQFKLLNWYTTHPLYIYIYIRERELKEKIENIEKTKISLEKENEKLNILKCPKDFWYDFGKSKNAFLIKRG